MAKGKLVSKTNIKRKPGYLYFVDGSGNIREVKAARGAKKGHRTCSSPKSKSKTTSAKKTTSRKRPTAAQRKVQAKMKAIAKKWNKSSKSGKYTDFVKREMKK